MVTSNPGSALSGVWPHPVGVVEQGALADLIVVRRSGADVYRSLIEATETDIRLVIVGGRARYGLKSLMARLAPSGTVIAVGRMSRVIDYGDPAVTWKTVLAELEEVRADPAGASGRAALRFAALAAADQAAFDSLADNADSASWPADDGFLLLPDMPAPELDDQLRRRGPVGATPEPVVVPPLEPLVTGSAWFDAVDANPFHHGLLSGLRAYA